MRLHNQQWWQKTLFWYIFFLLFLPHLHSLLLLGHTHSSSSSSCGLCVLSSHSQTEKHQNSDQWSYNIQVISCIFYLIFDTFKPTIIYLHVCWIWTVLEQKLNFNHIYWRENQLYKSTSLLFWDIMKNMAPPTHGKISI